MNDAAYEATKKRIENIMASIKSTLLPRWQLRYEFIRGTDKDGMLARVTPLWQYRKATIEFFMPNLVEETNESIVETLVHESMHCVLAPLQDLGNTDENYRGIVEMTTQDATDALFEAIEARDLFAALMKEESHDTN